MPIVALPDGNRVDLGDSPSPELLNRVRSIIDKQRADKAGATTTPTTSPPAESTTATTTSDTPPPPSAGWGPTIARTAGPIAGSALFAGGALLAGQPELVPLAISVGAGVGGFSGDMEGQRQEIAAGERVKYNPGRGLAEAATNVAFAGIPMGDVILPAVAKAGTLGVVSSNAISISEGQGLNSAGQNALAFLTAGGLQAAHGTYSQVREMSVKEVSAVPEIEEHVNVMTGPGAPTHGPDGVPTEIPSFSFVDEFGRPIERQGTYPLREGIPGPPAPGMEGSPFQTRETNITKQTGLDLASKKNRAKQAVMDTWMEQQRPGIFEAHPAKDIPPLEDVHVPLLEKDGGLDDLISQGKEPPHDIPGNGEYDDPSPLTMNLMRYTGRTKTYFQRLENETGYPVYQDYDGLSQANRHYQILRKDFTTTAANALKGSDRSDWNVMLQDLYAGAEGDSVSPKMRPKVRALLNVTDRAMKPYGLTAHDFWAELVPALTNGDAEAVGQEKFAKIGEALIEGKVNIRSTDLPRLMQQITNIGAFEEGAGDTVRALKTKYSAKNNPDIPESVRQAMQYYTKVLDGTPDRLSNALGSAITHVSSKFGWEVNGSGLANRIVSAQYAAMMAGRPGPAIRNSLQTIQTASPLMGYSWLAEGYRQVLTAEGKQLVERSGVSAESVMNELANIGKTTRPGRLVDATVSKFMAPFGFAENINRGSVYLGTRAKILWAAEKYGTDTSKFLQKSGIGRYSKQEMNIVLDLFTRGKLSEAADRGAQMMVDNTQFMYSQFERARIMTGAGRSMGAFGMWPMQYGGYMARLLQKGGASTYYDVGRDFSRFLVSNSALLGTFYGLGKFFNADDALRDNLGWLFLAPAVYTGSPLTQTIYQGSKDIQQTLQGKPPKAKEVFRNVTAPLIPFYGLGQDYVKARKEPNLGEGLARFAGIKRGASPKSKSFGSYQEYGSRQQYKKF